MVFARFRLGAFAATAALAAAVIAAPAGASVVLDQSASGGFSDGSHGLLHDASNDWAEAQTFTVGVAGILDHIDVLLGRNGSVPNNLTLSVETVAGGIPSGVVLATKTLTESSISIPLAAMATFDVSGAGLNVTVGESLAFVLEDTLAAFTGGQYFVSAFTDDYAGGNDLRFISGTGWLVFGGDDTTFSTYVRVADAAAPEPASLALLGVGLAVFGVTRRRRA